MLRMEPLTAAVPQEATAGRLYMNPKDHKRPDPVTNIPPMREVVSGSGSNTEGLSKIVTHYINPVNKSQPSYTTNLSRFILKVYTKICL